MIKEEKTPLDLFMVEARCPKCMIGKLAFTGRSGAGGNEHLCTNCEGQQFIPHKTYPKQVTEKHGN